MALVQTTISAAIGVNDLIVPLTSATGVVAGYVLRIDSEFMVVHPSYVSGTNVPVYRRGDQGSAQVAHVILATAVVGIASDWPAGNVATYAQVPPQGTGPNPIVNIGADVTITYPNVPTTFMIDKATAAAITLSGPLTKGADGVICTFYSNVAAAHTITYTPGFYGDTTSSDVATFASKVGASASFVSSRGLVGVYALANVTLA